MGVVGAAPVSRSFKPRVIRAFRMRRSLLPSSRSGSLDPRSCASSRASAVQRVVPTAASVGQRARSSVLLELVRQQVQIEADLEASAGNLKATAQPQAGEARAPTWDSRPTGRWVRSAWRRASVGPMGPLIASRGAARR
jgi:hypothetical protein